MLHLRFGRRLGLLLVLLISGLLFGAWAGQSQVHAAGDWQYADRDLRVPVDIGADGYGRTNKYAEVAINFSDLFNDANVSGALDLDSIRVVEVNAGGTALDTNVPFQFDRATNYNATSNAAGELVIYLAGQTAASATRHFHVYFDKVGTGYSALSFPTRVTLTDGVNDQGFSSYRIETADATYVYHKQGGGFSKLLDGQGNDWISWNSAAGPLGDYRGIPNLVNPNDGGFFHPGRTTSSSAVLNEGPLRATFKSTSNGGAWETVWDIYPEYARLTVTKSAKAYWFLYEGTPGGALEQSDRNVRPNGNETSGFNGWVGDLPGEEWTYFRDQSLDQVLFLASEQEDTKVDSYRSMSDSMTIFGFGRNEGSGRYLTGVPQSFVFGFGNGADHNAMTAIIQAAYKPLSISKGPVEKSNGDPGPVCDETAETVYLSSKEGGSIEGVNFADEDIVAYDGSTCTWSLAFDGSAAGLPGGADIDALEVGDDGTFYMSFDTPVAVPGISGKADDSDVVAYDNGNFSLWFDGSAFGLTTTNEDIDALTFDNGGNLIISTLGSFALPGPVKGTDEDLAKLSSGTWSLLFDGSHNAGLSSEDVNGTDWLADETIRLSMTNAFNTGSVSGDGNDMVNCAPTSLGPLTTTCNYTKVWDGSDMGFMKLDAFAIVPIP